MNPDLSAEELDELFSAYLDQEATPAERELVQQLIGENPHMRAQFDEMDSTRSLVRGLPHVAPRKPLVVEAATSDSSTDDLAPSVAPGQPPASELPEHTDELSIKRRRTLPWVATAAVSVAAVWLLVIGLVGGGDLRVVPDVEALALRHASAAEAPMVDGYEPMDVGEIKMQQFVPDTIGHDMDRGPIYQQDTLIHAMFTDGDHTVSVFHEPGTLDWDSMPPGGEMMEMKDGKAWHQLSDMGNVLITEKAGQVVIIVADADMGDEMVFSIPELL